MKYITKRKYKKLVNLIGKLLSSGEEYELALEYAVVDSILERLHIKVEK